MTNHTINGISNISSHFDSIDELASMKSMDYPVVGTGDVMVRPTKSRKQGCTARETGLVVALVILVLLAVGLIVLLAIFSYNNTSECLPKVTEAEKGQLVQEEGCKASTCIHLASRVLSLMNTRTPPCEDFYQYACGEGEKGSYISWLSPTQSAYNKATKENQRRIREVLEVPGTVLRGVNSSAVGKAKTYYNSCTNMDLSDQEGRITILKLIKDLGSWPMTTDALSGMFRQENFDLEDRLSRAFRAGSFPVMVLTVNPDPFNASWSPLLVGPGVFQVSYKPGNLEAEMEAFVKFFTTVTTSFGVNPITADEYAKEVWNLGLQLFQISQGLVWRNELSNIDRPTASEFSATTRDYLDFGKLVRLTFGDDVPENERMLVLQTDYFERLGPILNNADKRVLATYIIWQVLVDLEPYLYKEIRQAREEQQKEIYGALTVEEARWETCVIRTVALFPDVIDGLYVEQFVSDDIKQEAFDMLEKIQSTLTNQLSETGWMDTATVTLAREKLDSIDRQIGYQDHVLYPAQLDMERQHIGILNPYHELDNVREIRKSNYIRTFQQRNEILNKTWKQSATEVLGLYDRYENKIKFTAGHFQYPYYERAFTWAMKMGTMGHLMAHELTHAVDSQGRLNDATGELKNWWTLATNLSYSRHSKCFEDDIKESLPYASNIYLLNEVIADTGGIKLAYKAFKDSRVSSLPDTDTQNRLPGLDLTDDKLIFLAYAQMFCVQDHLTASNYKKYRVLTSLKNSDDFAEVFSCPTGSPMNPTKKCTVW